MNCCFWQSDARKSEKNLHRNPLLYRGNPSFCTWRMAVYGNLMQGNLKNLMHRNCTICQQGCPRQYIHICTFYAQETQTNHVYGNLMQINLTNRQQKFSPIQRKSMCVGRRIAVFGNLMQGNLKKKSAQKFSPIQGKYKLLYMENGCIWQSDARKSEKSDAQELYHLSTRLSSTIYTFHAQETQTNQK